MKRPPAAGIGALIRAVLVATTGMTGDALAQPYPNKPVRFIVNFPPGGGSDILARNLTPALSNHLGQQVIVDNRPGAAGNIGAELAAKAPADGYTLLLVSSSHAANVALYKDLPFHPVNSFAPVVLFGASPQVLLSNPAGPYKSVKDLTALAKKQPGKINFASAGSGSTTHLAGELLKSMAGISLTHIPYKGGGPALTDLIGGHVDLLFLVTQTALPQINAGRLTAVAVTSVKRVDALPQVPTIAEQGVPGYEAVQWFGMLTPAGTPREVVMKLHAALTRALQDAEVKKRFLDDGAEVTLSAAPEDFGVLVRAEVVKWAKVVKDAGIQPE